jgi:hypothetical protein
MQQVGGSLGLAVLVTVFGTASSDAAARPRDGRTPAQFSQHVFTVAADTAFWMASAFVAATLLIVIFAIRTPLTPAVLRPAPERVEGESTSEGALALADCRRSPPLAGRLARSRPARSHVPVRPASA